MKQFIGGLIILFCCVIGFALAAGLSYMVTPFSLSYQSAQDPLSFGLKFMNLLFVFGIPLGILAGALTWKFLTTSDTPEPNDEDE